jgi:pectin methylesterase-like acyl-CoA thioesterase
MRNRAVLALLFPLMVAFFSTVLSITIMPVKGSTRNWIVDDDGSSDFQTIQEAINAASNGDTVLVFAGVYY